MAVAPPPPLPAEGVAQALGVALAQGVCEGEREEHGVGERLPLPQALTLARRAVPLGSGVGAELALALGGEGVALALGGGVALGEGGALALGEGVGLCEAAVSLGSWCVVLSVRGCVVLALREALALALERPGWATARPRAAARGTGRERRCQRRCRRRRRRRRCHWA